MKLPRPIPLGLVLSSFVALAPLACVAAPAGGDSTVVVAPFVAGVKEAVDWENFFQPMDMVWHTITHQPSKAVLVVTTEALSHVVDPADYDTAILFGDAATATIVRGTTNGVPASGGPHMFLRRPVLSGKADATNALTVGFRGQGHVHMDGKKVFAEATRAMTKMTRQAFEESGIPIEQMDFLVPHQANKRIMEAVRGRLDVPAEKVIDMTEIHGNTSSSSIPISIAKSTAKFKSGQKVGVCAFGGGFTFGAAVLEVV